MNKTLSLVAGLAMTLAASVCLAADEQARTVTITPIKGPLYMLAGQGGRVVASVGEDGVLLVDNDYPAWSAAYAAALKKIDAAAGAPRFMLNTHWHNDHTGNNGFWAEQGALVMAHENIYQRMSTRQDMPALGSVVEPSPAIALPVVTYADSIALRFNGDVIQVQHFPHGHTDGDSVMFFTAQNVVHVGDLYFAGAFPFVDLDSGGDVQGYIGNVEQVLAMIDDDTIIVPGHARTVKNKQEYQAWINAIKASVSEISARLEAGKTVDEVIAKGLGADFAPYGQGFIKEAFWIRTVTAGL
ncbi:MBL fold metallo-hydrolase [Seongchinamella sediminis]|uniref:MBL fold metallo-hydrolase n=1 Tax=Seongchinamella sediminis TaxID=2283635 RepID=A0A3L7DZW2_9GAMM|nr:MBL fold metallo-hydrolase [Seongchinamella sediminis]RLQ22205.1 MBL fold metallo-hydrolase [Seongchinamella sediminis]